MKLKFPEKYIKHGKFKLHSGGTSNVFYDVNALMTDEFFRRYVLSEISFSEHYVGIATGGAIMAGIVSFVRKTKFSMVKDGELKGKIPEKEYILIDDVVTSGNSLLEAISLVGKNPEKIFAAVDRRENKTDIEGVEIISVFEP